VIAESCHAGAWRCLWVRKFLSTTHDWSLWSPFHLSWQPSISPCFQFFLHSPSPNCSVLPHWLWHSFTSCSLLPNFFSLRLCRPLSWCTDVAFSLYLAFSVTPSRFTSSIYISSPIPIFFVPAFLCMGPSGFFLHFGITRADCVELDPNGILSSRSSGWLLMVWGRGAERAYSL